MYTGAATSSNHALITTDYFVQGTQAYFPHNHCQNNGLWQEWNPVAMTIINPQKDLALPGIKPVVVYCSQILCASDCATQTWYQGLAKTTKTYTRK